MATEEEISAVNKALGEPCLAEFSDDALRVRRNLLVVSLLTLIGALFNVKIAPDTPVFGFHLLNLTDQVVRTGMTITIVYLIVHFAWYALDSLAGWRVRVTGTRQTFITTGMFGNELLDYTSDPKQSTLYNWWKVKRQMVGNLAERMCAIETAFEDLEKRLDEMKHPPQIIENSNAVTNGLSEVQRRMTELKSVIDNIQKVDTSPRIEGSLRRFDSWFGLWLRSQNMRWLVIDALTPLLMGCLALIFLLRPVQANSPPSQPAQRVHQHQELLLDPCLEEAHPPLLYVPTCDEFESARNPSAN